MAAKVNMHPKTFSGTIGYIMGGASSGHSYANGAERDRAVPALATTRSGHAGCDADLENGSLPTRRNLTFSSNNACNMFL